MTPRIVPLLARFDATSWWNAPLPRRVALGRMARCLSFALLVTVLPSQAGEAKWVAYEPEVVQLTGVIVEEAYEEDAAPQDRGKHAWILRLERPISLRAKPHDEINTAEENVAEVHLNVEHAKYAVAKHDLSKTRFTVSGTLYHQHTAHHLRPIVMVVKAIAPAPAR